jgi:hypothetical protein
MRSLFTLLLVLLAIGCSKSEAPTEAPVVARVVPDENLPKGTLATIALGDPAAFLEGASASVESAFLRTLVPDSTSGLLRSASAFPPSIGQHVETHAPLAGLVLEEKGGRATAFVVRLVEGAEITESRIEMRPGAPSGGSWLRDTAAEAQPEMALVGDLLFIGETREAIERAHRHLAHRLAQKGDGTLRITFHADALARHLRPILEEQVRAAADATLERIREARAEKGREPELGDPEAVVVWARDEGVELASLLPDVEDARIEVGFDGGMAIAALKVVAKAGSPLAARLDRARATEPRRVREILAGAPEGAAFALGLADGEGFASALKVLSDERLGEADRARVDAIFGASAPHALVGGGDREGGFLQLVRAGDESAPWDGEALAIAHVRTLFAALAGCEAPKKAPRLDKTGSALLCVTRETQSTLSTSSTSAARLLTLATTGKGTARKSAPEAARVDAHADVARALGAIGDDASYALYLEASRVIPALSLSSRFFQLRALESALAPRPIVLSAGATGRDVSLRAILARGSLDRFLALFGELGRLVAAP